MTRIDFTVTAADPGGHGVTRAFHATRRNTAPSFATTAGLGPLPYADPVSATIAASDAEGDDITYRLASGSPAWLAIDPVSGALSKSAARPHLDAIAFTVVAQDSAGGSTERAFTVELDDPRSCEEIFQATSATAATGTYRIDPDGDGADPIWAQCYMVASSARPGETGGWTAAASQVEGNPAGWQDGVAGRDASYTGTRSYALSSSELPQHTVTGFGRQLPGGGFESSTRSRRPTRPAKSTIPPPGMAAPCPRSWGPASPTTSTARATPSTIPTIPIPSGSRRGRAIRARNGTRP